MGKKAKRGIKKRNGSKSNRPSNPKSSETKQNPDTTKAQPPAAPADNKIIPEEKPEKRPLSWKIVCLLVSCAIFLFGFLGYDALWPKVVIDAAPAVDAGIFSYQFSFANQCCYPIKVKSVIISAIDMRWPHIPDGTTNNDDSEISDIFFKSSYAHVQIGGRESIEMKFDFLEFGNSKKLCVGSKIKMKVTYQVPLLHIEKSDAALFESAQDNSGNPIWIKKPMGEFANYEAKQGFNYVGTNEIY